jgi:hypothetical protein
MNFKKPGRLNQFDRNLQSIDFNSELGNISCLNVTPEEAMSTTSKTGKKNTPQAPKNLLQLSIEEVANEQELFRHIMQVSRREQERSRGKRIKMGRTQPPARGSRKKQKRGGGEPSPTLRFKLGMKMTSTEMAKHHESFLYRMFFCYHAYISKYDEDPEDEFQYDFFGHADLRLKNSRDRDVESRLLSSYANDIKVHEKDPFPVNKPVEFIYDFCLYLNTHPRDLDLIKQIEGEERFSKFRDLVFKFKRLPHNVVFEMMQREFNDPRNNGYSPTRVNIVHYMCNKIFC